MQTFAGWCAGRARRAPGCLRVTRSRPAMPAGMAGRALLLYLRQPDARRPRPHINGGLPWFQTSPAAVVTGAVGWVALFHGGKGGAAGWVFRRWGTRSGTGQPAPPLKRKTSTVSYLAGQRRSAKSPQPPPDYLEHPVKFQAQARTPVRRPVRSAPGHGRSVARSCVWACRWCMNGPRA